MQLELRQLRSFLAVAEELNITRAAEDWNWCLPTWLEWLPRLGYEETPEALPEGATS
jgi:hypothetical protein